MSANKNVDYAIELSIPGVVDKGRLYSGYAYLLKTDVAITEIYPWLGELLFRSRAVAIEEKENAGKKEENACSVPLHLIGLFIDDDWKLLASHLIDTANSAAQTTGTSALLQQLAGRSREALGPELVGNLPCSASFASTFGGESVRIENPPCNLLRSLSAGNPMAMFQFVQDTLEQAPAQSSKATTGDASAGNASAGDATVGNATAGQAVNLVLLNSLSSLVRNVGFEEMTALLKQLLSETVWNESSSDADGSDSPKIGDNVAMMFAVLRQGVMRAEEERYIETLFDGVIEFGLTSQLDEKTWGALSNADLPYFRVQKLPRLRRFRGAHDLHAFLSPQDNEKFIKELQSDAHPLNDYKDDKIKADDHDGKSEPFLHVHPLRPVSKKAQQAHCTNGKHS